MARASLYGPGAISAPRRTLHLPMVLLLTVVTALVAGLTPRSAHAAGLLVPNDQSLPPLRVITHAVDVEIDGLIARTRLVQTFHNASGQRLEATYVFPIPEGADVTGFSMTFAGKMVAGEVLPAEEAALIYEQIVRQARDPGLIEFIGRRLLRMRVFPIEPESDTTIELSYQQICRPVATFEKPGGSGLFAFHYPLRTSEANAATTSLRFNVDLHSDVALKSIWSPTHQVEVVRDGEHNVRVAFESSQGSLNEDFLLLFDREDGDMGLSTLTHLGAADSDGVREGHFLLLINPKTFWEDEERIPQDVVFVMDTSGSMSGGKIEQAREALSFCLDQLGEGDRFNIVRFSTGFDLLFPEMRERNDEALDKARGFVKRFSAGGGTNILEALQAAVSQLSAGRRDERPMLIVFLTDGNGDRGRDPVMEMLSQVAAQDIAIFPFGVGHDVNTLLLDALATDYHGEPTYVQPGENLELVLGDFFSTISQPVLTDLELTLPEIGAMDVFPPRLGDLYHGQQVIVAGRMSEPLIGSVTLKAKRRGEPVEYTWENVAFTHDASATYVPRLWAGRKIGHLIDVIRRNGQSKELVGEVVALSQAYGIQTPYASYLVAPERLNELADALANTRLGLPAEPDVEAMRRGREQLRQIVDGSGGAAPAAAPSVEVRFADEAGDSLAMEEAEQAVTATTGYASNVVARVQAQLRSGRNMAQVALDERRMLVQNHGGRAYNFVDGYLIDQQMTEETSVTYIQFGSPAYFELVRNRADLRPALAANLHTVVQLDADNAVAVVAADGEEVQTEFTDAQRALFFPGDAPGA